MQTGRIAAALGLGAMLAAGFAFAQDDQPAFGGEADTAYAEALWNALRDAGYAGDGAIQMKPYEGTEPHGAILQTFWAEIEVEGARGMLIVKRNFGPAGISVEDVSNDPDGNLDSVTVMFQREEGYAPDSANWFWAKYLPDGSLDQTPDGMALAGRTTGCIACHASAAGDDFVFTMDMQP